MASASFANPERFSEICYMPVDLVRDYSFLLKALTVVSRDVDPDLYDLLAQDWMRRFYANEDIFSGVNISQNSVPLGYGIVFGS